MRHEDQLPLVSVVVPVFNGGNDIERCMASIKASTYGHFECIVVDDASTDDTARTAAEKHGARLFRLDRQCGPAEARNRGVEEAGGDIIFFTDADVELHPDTLEQAARALSSDRELSAVFGSYDDRPGHASFISQYRNLFHHWIHQTSDEEASTFWTGCGAIRKDVFRAMGGFSADYERPSIEDIELGMRMRESGHQIRLLKNMFGKHRKRWGFWNMVYTDTFSRGVPWMLLLLRNNKATTDLNLSYKSRIATLGAGLLALAAALLAVTGHLAALLPVIVFLLLAAAGGWYSGRTNTSRMAAHLALASVVTAPLVAYWLLPDPLVLVPAAMVLLIAGTQLGFYRYVTKRRNSLFAIGVVPMQVVFFFCCATAIPIAYAKHHFGRRPGRADRSQ